jgi:hypothetical protein
MKYIILLALMLSFSVRAQTDSQIDALTTEMCKTLAEAKGADSVRVFYTLQQHLPEFLDKYEIVTEEAYNAVYEKIFFRFQKNCRVFIDMLAKSYEPQGDWQRHDVKPKGKLAKKACREISSVKNFYYLDNDGSHVTVTIDKGQWTEVFADGSYSKLNFKWTGDCEFEIEFIESDNYGRKNYSSKGDTYKYGIFDSNENGYRIWTEDADGMILSFTLYFKK